MKNKDYWLKRKEDLQDSLLNKADNFNAEIEKGYKQAVSDIEKHIALWYQRFADNNGVDLVTAQRILNAGELKELKWTIEEYIAYGEENALDGKWIKELENASARVHITRLESLKLQAQQVLEVLYGNMATGVPLLLGNIYKGSFFGNGYEHYCRTGVEIYFNEINENGLRQILNKPWTVDGKNFSERIWSNKKRLINELNNEFTRAMVTGAGPNDIAKNISKKLGSDLKVTKRLVLTESAYFSTQGDKDCYNGLDVEEYEILETLDGKTCGLCVGMDRKHYLVKSMQAGVTAPPFHPNCRGTTIPYFDDEFTENETRAYRDENGKTQRVEDMSYREWKEKFVTEKGQKVWDFYEKGAKNMTVDKEQYKRYKSVLGKNAPKSLEEFQKIKYNDDEGWADLKYYYRNISNRPIEYVKIDRELEKLGINGKGKAYPVEDIEIKGWRVHAENRLKGSNLTKEDAIKFKNEAIAMMKRYPEPNTVYDYYHDDGIIGVKAINNTVQTVIGKDRIKSETATIIEVMKKCLK